MRTQDQNYSRLIWHAEPPAPTEIVMNISVQLLNPYLYLFSASNAKTTGDFAEMRIRLSDGNDNVVGDYPLLEGVNGHVQVSSSNPQYMTFEWTLGRNIQHAETTDSPNIQQIAIYNENSYLLWDAGVEIQVNGVKYKTNKPEPTTPQHLDVLANNIIATNPYTIIVYMGCNN